MNNCIPSTCCSTVTLQVNQTIPFTPTTCPSSTTDGIFYSVSFDREDSGDNISVINIRVQRGGTCPIAAFRASVDPITGVVSGASPNECSAIGSVSGNTVVGLLDGNSAIGGATIILTFMNGSTFSYNIGIATRIVRNTLQPITPVLLTLRREEVPVTINITADLNPTTIDVIEVSFEILDGMFHRCGLGRYCGTTTHIPGGTLMSVSYLKINSVVRGTGTLIDKTTAAVVNVYSILEYVLVKVLMGRLTGCQIDLKWALRCNYKELVSRISNSIYYPILSKYLFPNSRLEKYLR